MDLTEAWCDPAPAPAPRAAAAAATAAAAMAAPVAPPAAPPAAPDALARLEQTLAAMEQRRARDHKMLLIAIVVFASLTLHRLELMQQRLRALGA